MEHDLERYVDFLPGYDRRDEDYGIAGVKIRFAVGAKKRWVSFFFLTELYPTHVQKELHQKPDRRFRPRPMTGSLAFHQDEPMSWMEESDIMEPDEFRTDTCEFLGGPCYSDVTSLYPEENNFRDKFLEEGDEAIFGELEKVWKREYGDELDNDL